MTNKCKTATSNNIRIAEYEDFNVTSLSTQPFEVVVRPVSGPFETSRWKSYVLKSLDKRAVCSLLEQTNGAVNKRDAAAEASVCIIFSHYTVRAFLKKGTANQPDP